MATYNGEKYITEQLDTIRNQTRKIDELVVCDDRSKDNTVSVVKAYIKEHNPDADFSFDIIEVYHEKGTILKIEHLENAF